MTPLTSEQKIGPNVLYADIGNSTIDFLVTDFLTFRMDKVNTRNRMEVFAYLKGNPEIAALYVSSVNSPGLTLLLDNFRTLYPMAEIHVLNKETMVSYSERRHIRVDNANILGADLFCDIVARDNREGEIIIDLGTASKILFVDQDSYFRGCQIFPGLSSFPETLHAKTDLLKNGPILYNPPLVSLKTEECISSGVINGASALIAGMIEEIKKEYGCLNPTIVLTGGNAYLVKEVLKKFTDTDYEYDPYHVLKGLIRISGRDVSFMKEKR